VTVKRFLIHLALILLFFVVILFLSLFVLRMYTNHGQKLTLPQYIGESINFASEDAENKSFKVIVVDSVHRLGIPGGQVLNQNPVGGSKVKENRKIYLTIAKYGAEFVLTEDLPKLYGMNYEFQKRRLEADEITSAVASYVYDYKSEPNTILSASYNGKKIIANGTIIKGIKIEKGGTIEFVLSKSDGGIIDNIDVTCKPLDEVQFLLSASNLNIGNIIKEGEVTNLDQAWVYRQDPSLESSPQITTGSNIILYVVQQRPPSCQ